MIELLKQKEIHFKSLSEAIDTSTATGNLFFQFMCVLAEHERNVIREQTKAGLESARARSRSGGRPEGLSVTRKSPWKSKKCMKGMSIAPMLYGMFQIKSQPTLYKILQFAGSNVKGFLKKRGNIYQNKK
ncbi:recombinase family protein [Dyadobacter sp. LHD-138]|uniref:recombinase family protein n=1 Tax=Dyadobacter sp. LHD-138 TaxID=3071413 RepID=UPI0027E1E827|nr:recombinase family protein [Dyadobacter sp. LHD-138]MDQ6480709.1 recombinase family protein [Dyadobacter sp. LHD-138]